MLAKRRPRFSREILKFVTASAIRDAIRRPPLLAGVNSIVARSSGRLLSVTVPETEPSGVAAGDQRSQNSSFRHTSEPIATPRTAQAEASRGRLRNHSKKRRRSSSAMARRIAKTSFVSVDITVSVAKNLPQAKKAATSATHNPGVAMPSLRIPRC